MEAVTGRGKPASWGERLYHTLEYRPGATAQTTRGAQGEAGAKAVCLQGCRRRAVWRQGGPIVRESGCATHRDLRVLRGGKPRDSWARSRKTCRTRLCPTLCGWPHGRGRAPSADTAHGHRRICAEPARGAQGEAGCGPDGTTARRVTRGRRGPCPIWRRGLLALTGSLSLGTL